MIALVKEHGLTGLLLKGGEWDRPSAMESGKRTRPRCCSIGQNRDAAFGMLNYYRASPIDVAADGRAVPEVPAGYAPPPCPNWTDPDTGDLGRWTISPCRRKTLEGLERIIRVRSRFTHSVRESARFCGAFRAVGKRRMRSTRRWSSFWGARAAQPRPHTRRGGAPGGLATSACPPGQYRTVSPVGDETERSGLRPSPMPRGASGPPASRAPCAFHRRRTRASGRRGHICHTIECISIRWCRRLAGLANSASTKSAAVAFDQIGLSRARGTDSRASIVRSGLVCSGQIIGLQPQRLRGMHSGRPERHRSLFGRNDGDVPRAGGGSRALPCGVCENAIHAIGWPELHPAQIHRHSGPA